MRTFILSLLACAIAVQARSTKAQCPVSDYNKGAAAVKAFRLENICKVYLQKSSISSCENPSNFFGCSPLLVQQSCLVALGRNPACAPANYQNYGSYPNSNGNGTMENAIYVSDKTKCCDACYKQTNCVAYEYMPTQKDVSCGIYTIMSSPSGNSTSSNQTTSGCPSSSYYFPTLVNAGTRYPADTYEYGPCHA